MPLLATAVHVMIASPSDTREARDTVELALHRWNEANSLKRGYVLIPLRWETSAVPALGAHPQEILNTQLVDRADIVIALFGSRLGSATPNGISGTVEEMQQAVDSGKPVHTFFSNAPHAADVDLDQLAALRDFKMQLQERGLYGEFTNAEELIAKVWQVVAHDLDAAVQPLHKSSPAAEHVKVDILVQGHSEREPKTDSKGRLTHTTRRWVEVHNRGTRDAEEVVVTAVGDGIFLGGGEAPRSLHAGQSRTVPMMLTMAAGEPSIRVEWTENGERMEKVFDV